MYGKIQQEHLEKGPQLIDPERCPRLISSTRMESGPQFSPDGREIAFESTRSGAYEVWLCGSDGTNLMQLTHFGSSDRSSTLVARRAADCFRFSSCRQCRHFRHRFSGRPPESLQGSFERSRAKLVAGRTLDIFRIRSDWWLGSLENAFDRWVCCTSDTPGRICSVRIDQRKIFILCKRPECFRIVAHSDKRWRRDRAYKLPGSRLLGLLGSGRERHLSPRHDHETWDRVLRHHYPSDYANVRSGGSSSQGRRRDWPSRRTRGQSSTHNWMRQIATSSCGELPIAEPE